MELKTLLLPEKTVTFEFPGCEGLTFDLTFLSKESNQKLVKKCTRPVVDSKTRQTREEFDSDLFLKLYVSAIVKGWSGFKLKYLKELVLVEVPKNQEEELLDYSDDNALELMKNSTIFDNWVSGVIEDISNFTTKNSSEKLKSSKVTSKSPAQD